MGTNDLRQSLLGGAAFVAMGVVASMLAPSPARADSVCVDSVFVTPLLTIQADCTSPNGNGTAIETSTLPLGVASGAGYVVDFLASPQNVSVSGYIEATTVGTGVMRVNTNQALTFVGTGSTLVATGGGATVLKLTAPSANVTTGTLTAVGGTSLGLDATSTGGTLMVNTGTVTAIGGTNNVGVKTLSTGGTNTTITTSTTVAGDNSIGVLAGSTDSNVALTTGTTIANGDKVSGVSAYTTGGLISGSSTMTNVAGSQSNGINLAATGGSINYNSGTVVVTTTDSAVGVYAGSSGAGGTNLTTGTTTLFAVNNGTGVLAMTNTGPLILNSGVTSVTGTNGTGLYAQATDGSSLVNTGMVIANGTGSTGVYSSTLQSSGTCGTNTVNVTGGITGGMYGVHADGCGTSTVTVNPGAYVVTSAGTATILNSATTVATTIINGQVGANVPSFIAIDNNGTSSSTTLGATGDVIGAFNGTAGTDTFNMTAGSVWTVAGTSDFQGGADTLTNGGTILFAGLTNSFAGLETFANTSTGRVYLPAGTLLLPSVTSFTNAGTVIMGGTSSTLTSLAPLVNSGTVSLRNINTTTDVLTITNNYVGNGGTLAIDANDTTADRLVIGGAASGTTSVDVNYSGTGLINVGGILVVDTGTSTANAFTLGTVSGSGSPLIAYSLDQVGADYYLTAAPSPSAFDPAAIGNLAGSIWYQSADEVFAQTDQPATTVGASFWGQAYYSEDRFGDRDDSVDIGGTAFDVDNRVKTKRLGIQAGADYGFGGARIGLTGGYGRAKAHNDLNSAMKATGWNLGVYGQFGGLTGFHGSGLIKYDRYKLRFTDGAFAGEGGHLKAFGGDGSLGYRFAMGDSATIDAKLGLSHVRTEVDDISAFGFDYDIGRIFSTRGRAGVRATFGGGFAPYVDATLYHEFAGDRNVTLSDGLNSYDIGSGGKGTWGRIEAGISSNGGPGPIAALWADLGDKRGFGVRAGFRFGGRAAEMIAPPPPPPPPPPEPAPATQTCPDGSVILATDACPAPPPPPPPPPPPEPAPERG